MRRRSSPTTVAPAVPLAIVPAVVGVPGVVGALAVVGVLAVVGLAACGSSGVDTTDGTASASTGDTTEPVLADSNDLQQFPEIVHVRATESDGTWAFDVTISSPYDSPERYADAWRVLDADGTEYGERILTHDHASEQPFTRSLAGVEIPGEVTVVYVEARDLQFGWSGETVEVLLP